LKLYYHPASTTSRIVMLFAADQKVALDYQVVDLFSGEHLKPAYASINPNCLVPMLEDGDFRLTESSAILKYLADKTGSPAYPKDLRERARVNEMMDWFNANLYRDFAYGLIYPQLFPHHLRPTSEIQQGTLAWAKERAAGWLRILDQHLLGPNKAYLCGDRITLADYLGAEMIAAGDAIRCDFSAYPNVDRWLSRMKALESWPKVNEVFDGFVASLKGKALVPV
jgi:glutathione S-transferase